MSDPKLDKFLEIEGCSDIADERVLPKDHQPN